MSATRIFVLAPLVVAAAACSNGSSHVATPPLLAESPSPSTSEAPVTTPSATPSAAASGPAACQTSALSLRLGSIGAAAGSTYQPLIFTNAGSTACTLYGYPGVAFVAPGTGAQVGSAAMRNSQHPSTSVSLAPGASASSLVQIAQTANYPAADCQPSQVSGLRVYPPGNTTATYVAFASNQSECAKPETQLSVTAVLRGTTGQ